MTDPTPVGADSSVLVFGYGLHGQAVAHALVSRDIEIVVADDGPSPAALDHARALGVTIEVAPDQAGLDALVATATHVIPTPGLPEHHRLFDAAERHGAPIISEFDLAGQWDDRPLVAITGTNGKTTVTTMVTEMLQASGVAAVMSGNMEVPLVTAIDDPATEMFVVEASSFRLGHSSRFDPTVGTWLNFDPDHLDVHPSLAHYEAAKARIWATQGVEGVAIGGAADPVVMRNMPGRPSDRTFGREGGDASVVDGQLTIEGAPLVPVEELARNLPHDIDNALAAALTAIAAGATTDAAEGVLRRFTGLPHRVQLVGERDGVSWYNDSKATTPHAVMAGLGGFDHAVLIAGGRNKGVDLTPLATLTPRLRGVVAIGESAEEVASVFAGFEPVSVATSMEEAVLSAAEMAIAGDAVVLSPSCTSYDWYPNYGARGDDFADIVRRLVIGPCGEVVS